jgi:hypothetical protein
LGLFTSPALATARTKVGDPDALTPVCLYVKKLLVKMPVDTYWRRGTGCKEDAVGIILWIIFLIGYL